MQDLQVTIEVRFITLNDNFFERIGVSFDFDYKDNIIGNGITFNARTPPPNIAVGSGDFANTTGIPGSTQSGSRTIAVGMSSPSTFSSDLDVPFTQNSFALAVPQFGGFDATAGAARLRHPQRR